MPLSFTLAPVLCAIVLHPSPSTAQHSSTFPGLSPGTVLHFQLHLVTIPYFQPLMHMTSHTSFQMVVAVCSSTILVMKQTMLRLYLIANSTWGHIGLGYTNLASLPSCLCESTHLRSAKRKPVWLTCVWGKTPRVVTPAISPEASGRGWCGWGHNSRSLSSCTCQPYGFLIMPWFY